MPTDIFASNGIVSSILHDNETWFVFVITAPVSRCYFRQDRQWQTHCWMFPCSFNLTCQMPDQETTLNLYTGVVDTRCKLWVLKHTVFQYCFPKQTSEHHSVQDQLNLQNPPRGATYLWVKV